jgi:hypothetical protein
MKKTLGCLAAIIGLLYLPLSFYSSWLLYQHVQATDVMWLLFWINVPITTILAFIGKIIEQLGKNE